VIVPKDTPASEIKEAAESDEAHSPLKKETMLTREMSNHSSPLPKQMPLDCSDDSLSEDLSQEEESPKTV
jgi:hypothetical protein